ncbi:hypothetical protein [Halorussus salinisoli]|uniref:hypothetical protein n=1 Tax=Halorussus salinisoli TaxID=2558242 RepID=UPI0010C16515|nr:hypothetical protein [Halorussus salinisoli]
MDAGEFLPYADVPVWCISAQAYARQDEQMLYDTCDDPKQQHDLAGDGTEADRRLQDALVSTFADVDAPGWKFNRLGLERV